MEKERTVYDIVVLGGGPGGYPAAIRAAQLGKKVALVEQAHLGGTCLNQGCIPTKTLIANADVLKTVQEAAAFGVEVRGEVVANYSKMAERKDQIVSKMRQGLQGLVAANAITLWQGRGELLDAHQVRVTGKEEKILQANTIILATGSEPRNMAAFPFDGERVHSSTSILALTKLPSSLVIIGGGVIGCEFASLYAHLGVKVTVLEALEALLPMQPPIVSKALQAAFQRRGIEVRTGISVTGIQRSSRGVEVMIGKGEKIEAELALVAVGRVRNTTGIGLEKAGLSVGKGGEISTNAKMETEVPGLYAVGDITKNWWLAHVATHQGIVAAEQACGLATQMHENAIPSIIFTDPEIATVGLSLEEAKKAGYEAEAGSYPFEALGKAQAAGHPEGFAQIVVDKKRGQLLGAQVVGADAATLIAEMGLAIANELTVECLIETIHAHPTLPEAWLEAALVAQGIPLHLPPKKKRATHG